MAKKKWKKDTLKLKQDHLWKAKPGYTIFVADRGAVRFDIPQGWIIEPGPDSTKFYNGAAPFWPFRSVESSLAPCIAPLQGGVFSVGDVGARGVIAEPPRVEYDAQSYQPQQQVGHVLPGVLDVEDTQVMTLTPGDSKTGDGHPQEEEPLKAQEGPFPLRGPHLSHQQRSQPDDQVSDVLAGIQILGVARPRVNEKARHSHGRQKNTKG